MDKLLDREQWRAEVAVRADDLGRKVLAELRIKTVRQAARDMGLTPQRIYAILKRARERGLIENGERNA